MICLRWSKNPTHLQVALNSMRTENPRPTGRGGTTSVVGEGLANIIKSLKN